MFLLHFWGPEWMCFWVLNECFFLKWPVLTNGQNRGHNQLSYYLFRSIPYLAPAHHPRHTGHCRRRVYFSAFVCWILYPFPKISTSITLSSFSLGLLLESSLLSNAFPRHPTYNCSSHPHPSHRSCLPHFIFAIGIYWYCVTCMFCLFSVLLRRIFLLSMLSQISQLRNYFRGK